MTQLSSWQNFYVIVGSSAGALIGLQFVVITLIASLGVGGAAQGSSAFATPNVTHLGTALLLSAVLSAPWPGIGSVAVAWGLLGLIGVLYSVIVVRRMRLQTAYHPVFEDWLFHALLPFAAYVILAVSAYSARGHAGGSLFAVGAAALLLLFIGIHNAWDSVTYHVFVARRRQHDADAAPPR